MSNGNREIERKYLLTALPPRVLTAPAVHIDQGYLPGTRINERVRRSKRDGAVRYYRTIKSGVGIEKLEIEEEIDERFFAAVWPLTLLWFRTIWASRMSSTPLQLVSAQLTARSNRTLPPALGAAPAQGMRASMA